MLDHLGFDMDRVAIRVGPLTSSVALRNAEAGVLHRRQEQALGKGVDQCGGYCSALIARAESSSTVKSSSVKPAHVDEARRIGFR